jgi:hypothetical protein
MSSTKKWWQIKNDSTEWKCYLCNNVKTEDEMCLEKPHIRHNGNGTDSVLKICNDCSTKKVCCSLVDGIEPEEHYVVN